MIRSILVPMAPSPYRDQQVAVGLKLAERTGARLQGAAVLDLPELTRPQPVPAGGGAFVDQDHKKHISNARETADEILARFKDECDKAKVACETTLLSGHPAEEVRKAAPEHDLILVARGCNFKYATQESPCQTTRQIMKHNPRPMIFVSGTTGKAGRILIATDGSASVARSIQIYLALGLFADREIEVVSIAAETETAQANCDQVRNFLKRHELDVSTQALASKAKPFDVLLSHIRDNAFEAVVMGAFGISGWKEVFFGSATLTLLENCPVPLWIHH